MKYLILSILLASCAPAKPADNPAEVYSQDMESCSADPSTPWCIASCKDTPYSWCTK